MTDLEEVVADPTISTAELRRRLTDPGLTIVDVRPLPAYNGWRRSGEARGGHIPGAVAFPSAWLTSVDDREVERLLDTKGIVPSREVVLYGDEAERVSAVRARLMDLGHSGIRTYEPGWAEWGASCTTTASTTSARSTPATTGGSGQAARSRQLLASRRRCRRSGSRFHCAPRLSWTSMRPSRSWPTRRRPRWSASGPGTS